MSDDLIVFSDEPTQDAPSSLKEVSTKLGKILTVDDDLKYQDSIIYALEDLEILSERVEILRANSAAEAALLLAKRNDIAVVLLDVVMEQDDAGLRLVETIRNTQGNNTTRIILLTGQPGVAPRKDVLTKFDINEYWNKSDIDHDTLRAVVTANMRSWQSIYELEQAKLGLQMVVDASRQLTSIYDRNAFVSVMVQEICKLISAKDDVMLCVTEPQSDDFPHALEDLKVVAAHGIGRWQQNDPIPHSLRKAFETLANLAVTERNHQFSGNYSVLYIPTDMEEHKFMLLLVESSAPLSRYHVHLLQVFSENISSGFMQISLVNKLSSLAYKDRELGTHNRNWLLRELENLTVQEMTNLELSILEVENFESHVLSYSEDILISALKQLGQTIQQQFANDLRFARINTNTFAILVKKSPSISNHIYSPLVSQQVCTGPFTVEMSLTIARIDLALVTNLTGLQILHVAKSLRYVARQNEQHLTEYHPEHRENLLRDYKQLSDIKCALNSDEFCLALQPKIDLSSGHPVGFEGLIRWKKSGKVIPPDAFIPLAEQTGLITELDTLVIKLVQRAQKQLHAQGCNLPIAFNATVSDLENSAYLDTLFSLLDSNEIDAKLIEIEITETQAMTSYESISPVLSRLHEHGVKISIDDFGTGYSSLAHISHLIADTIKIDITFVRGIETDKKSQQVVELMITLAKQLGFTVVAEGIETEQQRHELLSRGCKLGQGYLFAKPMFMEELLPWLAERQD